MKATPSVAMPSPAEEGTPEALLTQTPTSPSPANCLNAQGAGVEVTLDKLTYGNGEMVSVTICNYLPETIFAPPPGECSVVTVERLENTRWVTEGSCPAQEVYLLSIPPRSQVTNTLWPISQAVGNPEPVISEPIPPDVFEGNLQDLPTSTPFQFPPSEVPEGAITAPFSLISTNLLPGTYRIKFSFAAGHPAGSVQTTYSTNFMVSD